MKLYLTDGMYGPKLKQLGGEFKSRDQLFEHIYSWKQDPKNKKLYKIETYDRISFGHPDHKNQMCIDFGDYSTFMLIDNICKDEEKGLLS